MSVLFFLVSAPGGKIDGRTSTSQWMCVPGSWILQVLSCKKRMHIHWIPPPNTSKSQFALVSEALNFVSMRR